MAKKIKIETNNTNTKVAKKIKVTSENISNKKRKNNKKGMYITIAVICGFVILGLVVFFNDSDSKFNIPIIGKTYYCPEDYELKGKKCYKTELMVATAKYYCNSGTLEGDQCVTETYYPVQTKDNCPTGYSMFGFKCRKWGTSTNYSKCGSFDMTYSYATNMCYAEVYPVETKYCNFGELYGNQCISKSYSQANYNYECPYDYIMNDNMCEKEVSIDAYIK